jgi:hypothetical protein
MDDVENILIIIFTPNEDKTADIFKMIPSEEILHTQTDTLF